MSSIKPREKHLFCNDPIHTLLPRQRQVAFVQYLVFPPLEEKGNLSIEEWPKWKPYTYLSELRLSVNLVSMLWGIQFTSQHIQGCGALYTLILSLITVILKKAHIQMPLMVNHKSSIATLPTPFSMKNESGFRANFCPSAAPSGQYSWAPDRPPLTKNTMLVWMQTVLLPLHHTGLDILKVNQFNCMPTVIVRGPLGWLICV